MGAEERPGKEGRILHWAPEEVAADPCDIVHKPQSQPTPVPRASVLAPLPSPQDAWCWEVPYTRPHWGGILGALVPALAGRIRLMLSVEGTGRATDLELDVQVSCSCPLLPRLPSPQWAHLLRGDGAMGVPRQTQLLEFLW